MNRGRPPATRARVLNYIATHRPSTIMQIVRGTGAERSHIKRMIHSIQKGHAMSNKLEMTAQESEKYWSRVDKAPGHGPRGACWIWRGVISEQGYPRFSLRGRHMQATHVALLLIGQERPDMQHGALHSCDVKSCVNPSHLRWGTDADNHEDVRQRVKRGLHWLPDEIVHEIHQSSERNIDIAARIGITPSAVCNIRKGRSHKHIFDLYCPITDPSEAT